VDQKATRLVTPQAIAEAFDRLRHRANQGDARAREALSKYLDSHPELWSRLGNMARHAELALIEAASGGEWLTAEAIKREAARMRRDLAGPSPSPLELMAIERVVLTWEQLQHVEMGFVQAQQNLGWARYWLQRQQQADRLHREAVKSLLLIRELLPTALQPATSSPFVNENGRLDGRAANVPLSGRFPRIAPWSTVGPRTASVAV
jgi:hypothetical protein